MATAVNVNATNNAEIDGLLGGTKWSGTITYSFPDSSGDYPTNYYGGQYTSYNMTPYCQTYVYPWSYGHSSCKYLGIWNDKYQYECITTCYI